MYLEHADFKKICDVVERFMPEDFTSTITIVTLLPAEKRSHQFIPEQLDYLKRVIRDNRNIEVADFSGCNLVSSPKAEVEVEKLPKHQPKFIYDSKPTQETKASGSGPAQENKHQSAGGLSGPGPKNLSAIQVTPEEQILAERKAEERGKIEKGDLTGAVTKFKDKYKELKHTQNFSTALNELGTICSRAIGYHHSKNPADLDDDRALIRVEEALFARKLRDFLDSKRLEIKPGADIEAIKQVVANHLDQILKTPLVTQQGYLKTGRGESTFVVQIAKAVKALTKVLPEAKPEMGTELHAIKAPSSSPGSGPGSG